MPLVDTHNHLYFDKFDADRPAVLARMGEAGVVGAVVIGIDPPTCAMARKLAAQHAGLAYSAGLHPTSSFEGHAVGGIAVPAVEQTTDGTPVPPGSWHFDAEAYFAPYFSQEPRPVAIGECGIDLHWDVNPLAAQQAVFRAQLLLARARGLPAIIHTRDANAETLAVLEEVPGVRGVLHCFNGSPELLAFALSREGWYVSFAGNLTYPKAAGLHDAARQVPLGRLLVETDAPFLAPQPVRGQRCEPAHVAHTARFLAQLRGMPEAELEAALLANARKCFGVDWS